MGDPVPTSAARQPDPDTGGPKDGDGSSRTVDTQPPTAPAPSSRRLWILLIVGGVLVVLVCAWVFFSTGLAVLLTIIALVGGSAYAMRNERIRRVVVRLGGLAFAGLAAAVAASQKKADEARQLQEEERRKAELKEQRKEQDRAALKAAFLSRIAPAKRNDAAVAAQIHAISNPETAKALQNLQNLLYTHVITEAEFQTAKDRLLGPQ